MSDSLYVKVGNSVEQVDLGSNDAPEYVQRIEALEEGQAAQNTAISTAQSTADSAVTAAANAQATADAAASAAEEAKEAANNITVPVTSVNGMTGAVTVGTVRSVNGVAADSAGAVSTMPDYSATVTLASNVKLDTSFSYTAPTNGILFFRMGMWANTSVTLKVNGSIIYNVTPSANGYETSPDISVPLSKGDIFLCEKNSANDVKSSAFFTPLKGA